MCDIVNFHLDIVNIFMSLILQSEEGVFDDLMDLVQQIVAFHMKVSPKSLKCLMKFTPEYSLTVLTCDWL